MAIECLHCGKNPTEDQVIRKIADYCMECELCKTMTRQERIARLKRTVEFNKRYAMDRTGYFACDGCHFEKPDWEEDCPMCSLLNWEVFGEFHMDTSPDNCPLRSHWLAMQYLNQYRY